MGLGSNGKLVFYTVPNLTRTDIADIGLKMLQVMPPDGMPNRPIIDMDINNIFYIRGRNKVNPMESVAKFAMEWAQHGIIITPVCDGDTRPTSKQASNRNRATREKNRNKAVTQRLDLRQINQQLNQNEITQETRDKLIKTRTTLEKSIKSAETQSAFAVPANLPHAFEDTITAMKLHEQNVAGGKVDKVLTGEFQADSLLAGRYLEGKCQMIMSTDGDFPIFCGDDCLLIKEFAGGKTTICSTSRKTLENALSYLDAKARDKAELVVPKHPIFEGVEDPKLRILMAVLIGCDVSPGGVHGAGPMWVANTLKEIMDSESNKSVYDQMIDHAVEKSKPKQKKKTTPKYSHEVLNTLVDAVLYEPTNAENDENATSLSHRTYMYGEPQKLASYLGEFRNDNTTIVDGPEVMCCKGPCSNGGASHKFLAAEDHHKCKGCNAIVCEFCLQKIDKDPYCLPCHLVEKLLPGTDPNDMMTVSQLREELKYQFKFGADADKLSIEEVEDAWEAHELQRAMEASAKTVRMPLCPTSAIASGSHWEKLADIDFRFGGSFLLDEKIDEKYLPAILELFASFVLFSPKETKHTKWEKDSSVYDAMPTMFINIAKECRLNSGYRLLKRCIRHAMDTRTESLDNKKAQLILYGNKVGIQLTTPIPASMKKEVYDGATVLTKDELLCASCGCTSGSEKEEKVACVHTLPRGFLLCLLLAEDLAEHMLLEMSSILTSSLIDQDTWSESQIASMKKSTLILMEASGDSSLVEKTKDSATLFICTFYVRRKCYKQR